MRRSAAVMAVLALMIGCGGDSGGSSAAILAQLYLLDDKGAVLTALPEGTKVLIDGEEIDLASVLLLSSPPPPPKGKAAGGVSNLTLYVPGYGGFDDPNANPAAGVTIQLIKRDLLKGLFLFAPTPGRVLVGDPLLPDASRTMCVQGVTKPNGAGGLRFDVVLAVDRSASTSRDSGIDINGDLVNDSVLAVECESLRRYIDALRGAVKIAVIAFERDPVVYQSLTDDKAAAKAALNAIQVAGSVGATDFQKAILASETLLTTDPNRTIMTVNLQDALGVKADQVVNAPRVVILCSDGVPTLPSGSGLSQDMADRLASLDAARNVVDNQVVVNTVAFGPEAAISKLTTMPGIAAITGGVYIPGNDFLSLAADPNIFGFSDVTGVRVWNASALQAPSDASFSPDGIFEQTVPWIFGDNVIHVRLVTREASLSVEETFTVKVVQKAGSNVDALVLSGDLVPLTAANFKTPDGKPVGGTNLKELLLTGPSRIFNDAVELKGLETFQPLNSNLVTIKVLSEHAGYASDFGFVEYDPAAPAANARALLKNGTAFKLGNSGQWGNGNYVIFADNNASTTYNVTMTPGKHYAFWVIPNGTLATVIANGSTADPLISVSKYNPVKADHFLSYLSDAGRIGTSNGRTVIMALEDIATIDQSDRDFNDIIFSILAPVVDFSPEFAAPRCN